MEFDTKFIEVPRIPP